MTLTEFLLARIAEDGGVARAYSNGNWTGNPYAGDGDGSDLRYAERFGPARVLAECKAHRRIVKSYIEEYGPDVVRVDHDILRALAGIYADHPDYREEWRP